MRFLVRDDDTCAFTRPEELVKCYEGTWDRIPVGLAVTPFRIPGDHHTVPESHRGSQDVYPLDGNKELVDFLREQLAHNRVEILLHGYHHTYPGGQGEYVAETDLARKTREGKAYLEELLGCTIDTFVPPNNAIGREGLDAITASGLNLVNVPSLLRPSSRPFKFANLGNLARIRYYRYFKGMQSYPHVLHFPDHKELSYYAITPAQRLEYLVEGLLACQREGGVFVAATHYHAFERKLRSGETVRRALETLFEHLAGFPDVQFPTFAKVWADG